MSTIYPRWEPPSHGSFKLNSDGSSLGNPGPASAGGVIRNSSGAWVIGFARNVGRASSFLAEHCMTIALEMNYKPIVIECDAQAVVQLINSKEDIPFHSHSAIIMECRRLMNQLGANKILHVLREANKVADTMTRKGIFLHENANFVTFDNIPLDVCNPLPGL